MAGYKKTPLAAENKVKRVKFSRFCRQSEQKNALVAVESFNCNCRGGRLRGGLGYEPFLSRAEPLKLPWSNKWAAGFYPILLDDDEMALIVITTDGYLYTYEADQSWTERVMVGSVARYLPLRVEQGKTYHIFSGGSRVVYTHDGIEFVEITHGELGAIATAGGRLFIVHALGRLQYSAPFAPETLAGSPQEGGELYMPHSFGEIQSIQGVGNYLYVFGAKSAYRLCVKADGTEFELEPLAYAGGRIMANGAVQVGGSIIFLAQEGLYRIEGKKIERVYEYLPIRPQYCNCRSGRFGDTILFEYAEVGGKNRRLALSADGEEGGFLFPLGALCGNGYFREKNSVYTYAPPTEVKKYTQKPYFETGWEWLESRGRKHLKRLIFHGTGSLSVEVCSGQTTRSYAVTLEKGRGEARLLEVGNAFVFRLYPNSDCNLESMTVEYVYLEE